MPKQYLKDSIPFHQDQRTLNTPDQDIRHIAALILLEANLAIEYRRVRFQYRLCVNPERDPGSVTISLSKSINN